MPDDVDHSGRGIDRDVDGADADLPEASPPAQ